MAKALPTLGRKKAHREHLVRNLATSLIMYEKIDTTLTKAKAVGPMIDRWISTAKKGTVASRRQLLAEAFDELAVKKIFDLLVTRYGDRASGFTRSVRLGNRLGDGAMIMRIELTDRDQIPLDAKEAKPTSKVTTTVVTKKTTKTAKTSAKKLPLKDAS